MQLGDFDHPIPEGVWPTYVVQNAGDTIVEFNDQGTDTIQSSVTFSLGINVENLTLTRTGAINATGNELDNVVIGNSAVNTLNGQDLWRWDERSSGVGSTSATSNVAASWRLKPTPVRSCKAKGVIGN